MEVPLRPDELEGMHALVAHRDGEFPLEALLGFIRAIRFKDGLWCPHCQSSRVVRWGTFSGRQRYRCRGRCGRTFSDLTGTPAAYLKKLTLWPAHAGCIARGLILRVVAERLGIHISTAFRWRHRVLNALRRQDDEALSGWIELRSEWFAESYKGARALGRPPRRHAVPSYWLRGAPHRRVVVACDRGGHVVTTLLDGPGVSGPLLLEVLGPRIRGSPTVLSERLPRSACAVFASGLGGKTLDPRSQHNGAPAGSARVGVAWAYGRRLKAWLTRFRGVATRYLPNYLIWHRRVDVADQRRLGMAILRWASGELGRGWKGVSDPRCADERPGQ